MRTRAGILISGALMLAALASPGISGAAPLGQLTQFSSGLTAGGTSQPASTVAGPDGNIWFTDDGATPAIGRITPSGTITEFTAGLNADSAPFGLTVGPDGNLWFTDIDNALGNPVAPAIGRITPSGTITEFTTGLPAGSFPTAITTEPDGNLWFLDGDYFATTPVSAIGRITPSGTITEFSAGLLTGNSPNAIAAGPDGNLWFTDDGSPTKAIGRITPSGTITEFSAGLPTTSFPGGIAAGPDGNLWFTDNGTAPAIGRITPSGTITEFRTGLPTGSSPGSIAAGADGNVWFGDNRTAGAIGRISTNGVISEFSSGGDTNIRGMTTGPDGNLWIANSTGPTTSIDRFGEGAPAASIAAPVVAGSGQQGTQQVCEGDRWSDWAGQQPALDAFAFDGYQWRLDGTAIAGQTGQSYTPVAGDVGHALSCTVTATYPLFPATVPATSAAVTVLAQASGAAGAPGVAGATGPVGPTGPTGAKGATGATGAAGQVELVTCKAVTKKVKGKKRTTQVCTTKLVSGVVKFTTTGAAKFATLSRDGVVYATGTGVRSGKTTTLTLRPAQRLKPGRYDLEIGSRGHRVTEVATVR